MNLDGYVTVNERLKLALAKYPDLRVEELPFDIVEIGGQTNLHCTVRVYTTPDDTRPVLGSVLEPIPGRTPYTRNSELMVGMTSALGRALGYLGFGIDKGIASNDEVAARIGTDREFDDAMPAVTRAKVGSRAKTAAQKAAEAALERGGGADTAEPLESVLEAFPGSSVKKRQEPTEKMIGFYKRLCRERSLEYDEQALVDFDACKAAIDRLKEMPRD
jgi:hypothetical protein